MINTVDQVISLVKEVSNPNIQILLDTFHANIEEKIFQMPFVKLEKDYFVIFKEMKATVERPEQVI